MDCLRLAGETRSAKAELLAVQLALKEDPEQASES
jgi:hypothetical protein